jgi:hypothetical protein
MTRIRGAIVVLLLATALPVHTYAQTAATAPAPQLTAEQMKHFLKNAKIVSSRTTDRGVTAPKRLTLTDGVVTHDAIFQSVDEKKMIANLGGGTRQASTELNFVDSYRYNLAAYALAELLGLDHMMPVYVERRWSGSTGSIGWWVTTMMHESDRLKKKIQPPNPVEWNHQMYRMRVFTALVRDTDRNLTNVLITPEWKVFMIDFTRGFRLQPELMYDKDLAKMDRALWAKLETLDRGAVKQAVGDWLTGSELDAMMKRRDLLIAHFKKLIAEVGEDKVLY